jgi:hypothetical protein
MVITGTDEEGGGGAVAAAPLPPPPHATSRRDVAKLSPKDTFECITDLTAGSGRN